MNTQLTKQEIEESSLHFLLGNTEKFSFQRQLINAATLLSTIISLMGVIASYVTGLQMTPLVFSFVSAGIFFSLYGVGRWKGYYVWVVWTYLVFNYIILFLYWRFIDGYMGISFPIILVINIFPKLSRQLCEAWQNILHG